MILKSRTTGARQSSSSLHSSLRTWMETHDSFRVFEIKASGDKCDYGVNPEDWPWNDSDEILTFEEVQEGCTFTTVRDKILLTLWDRPSDKWGNTATPLDGLILGPGFYKVAYENPTYGTEGYYPLDWDVDGPGYFLDFLKEKQEQRNLSFLSTISDVSCVYGSIKRWTWYITNQCFTDEVWLKLQKQYKESI
jgi:hypothetical protein